MPRIIVTTDPSPLPADASIWLDEHVLSVHLSTDHAAAQFVERLAWAISDAEDTDGGHTDLHVRPSRRSRRNRSVTRSDSRPRIHT